jgi:succinate-semialdehyde dehydrogenase / glutarate-semialdehyde dehydrogenase
MYANYGLFIDGKWRKASDGGTVPVMSPVTEKRLGEAPVATRADTEEALDSAALGFSAWKSKGGFERASALHAILAGGACRAAGRIDSAPVVNGAELNGR